MSNLHTRSDHLATLASAPAERLKPLAETCLPALGDIEVVTNRTALVMLPMEDSAQHTPFYLGEALIAEAHIRSAGHDGYGARPGHDLEAAMAMAVLDLCLQTDTPALLSDFLTEEAARQSAAVADRLRAVEATRVQMETF